MCKKNKRKDIRPDNIAGSQTWRFFMKINEKKFNDLFCFGITNIAKEILTRASEDERDDIDIYDKIVEALDNCLMYYDDQWEIMHFYQNPADANFQNAIEEFLSDLLAVVED